MNFGTVRKMEWLKFDQSAVDVLVLADKSFLLGIITRFTDNNDEEMSTYDKVIHNYDDMDIEELFKIANDLLQKHHQFCDFIDFSGAKYLNLVSSDLNPFGGDWDECTVLEFNINSFKIATFILQT